MVGSKRLLKQSQCRIAIPFFQVTQDLIVGAVFLDDVDYMPDVFAQESKHLIAGAGRLRLREMIIAGGVLRESLKFCSVRARNDQQSAFLKLPHKLLLSRT